MLVGGRRTAIGTAGHGLAQRDVVELAGPVLAALAADVGPLGREIDDVVIGNCLGPGGNVARVAALAAGLGDRVPGVSVDRQCGSGLEAVLQAASRVRAGDAELLLAGGAESASTAPWRFWPPNHTAPGVAGRADPVRYTRAPFTPRGHPDPGMGEAADQLARQRGVSRERQDCYAARSHQLTYHAAGTGRYRSEIVAVEGFSRDERPRDAMTAARLARLRPAFGEDGTATAGNSCGVSDGAAAVAVTTEGAARAAGLPYLRVLAGAVAAARPDLPGLAPAPAVRRMLDRPEVRRRGIVLADVGAFEITEAFASVVLAVVDELGVDESLVCTEGGAIGLGHPWGASGALLLLRLASRMLRPGPGQGTPALGVAACAIGGGQGLAVLLERPES